MSIESIHNFQKLPTWQAKTIPASVEFEDKLNYIKADCAWEWRPFSSPPLSTGNLFPYDIPHKIAEDHLAWEE